MKYTLGALLTLHLALGIHRSKTVYSVQVGSLWLGIMAGKLQLGMWKQFSTRCLSNLQVGRANCIYWKKSTCAWTPAVQTWVVQRGTIVYLRSNFRKRLWVYGEMRGEKKGCQKRYVIQKSTTMGDWSFVPLRNPGPSVENVSEFSCPKGKRSGCLPIPFSAGWGCFEEAFWHILPAAVRSREAVTAIRALRLSCKCWELEIGQLSLEMVNVGEVRNSTGKVYYSYVYCRKTPKWLWKGKA